MISSLAASRRVSGPPDGLWQDVHLPGAGTALGKDHTAVQNLCFSRERSSILCGREGQSGEMSGIWEKQAGDLQRYSSGRTGAVTALSTEQLRPQGFILEPRH